MTTQRKADDELLALDEVAPVPMEAWERLTPRQRDASDDDFIKAMSVGMFDALPKPKDWRE